MSKQDYPIGAAEDSRAPFNEKDLPEMMKPCPENCNEGVTIGYDEHENEIDVMCLKCEGCGFVELSDEEKQTQLWLNEVSAKEENE